LISDACFTVELAECLSILGNQFIIEINAGFGNEFAMCR